MAILVKKCPHCAAAHSSFQIFGFQLDPEQSAEDAGRDAAHISVKRWGIAVGAACPVCHEPISAVLRKDRGTHDYSGFQAAAKQLITSPHEVGTLGYKVQRSWPEAAKPTIPEHVAASVERAMLQAERNFPVAGNEEASAIMYRRTLEIALGDLHPTLKGSLAKRIKELVASAALPVAIGEWADEIRSLGNDAAHDPDEVDRAELIRIRGFADAFLRYLYTLPTEIAARRKVLPAVGGIK